MNPMLLLSWLFVLTFARLYNEQVFVGFLDLDSLSKLGLVHNNAKTREKIKDYSSFEVVEARIADCWIIKNKESKQTRVFNSKANKFLAGIRDEKEFQEFLDGFSLYDYDFILDENRKFVAAKERKTESLKYYFCDDLETKIWPKLFGNGFSLSYHHFLKDIDWGKSEFAITIKHSFYYNSTFKIFAHPPQRRIFELRDSDLENASIQVRKMYIKYNSIAEYKKFCQSKAGSNEEHVDPEMFSFLQKHGMDLKLDYVQGPHGLRSWQRYTHLHLAAIEGDLERVKMLLDADLNPNARDCDGVTPLMRAASCKHFRVVKCLVEEGKANISEEDVQGKSAKVWAKIPPGHENKMRYDIKNYDARTREIYYYLKEKQGVFGACIII